MVNQTKHVFYVGERAPDDSRQVKLEGCLIESRFSKGDILFLQGFSGKHEDYMHLLLPLGEEFRVITYNYRGHGGNKQRFQDRAVLSDVEQIIAHVPRGGKILAHSYGANLATRLTSDKIQRAYLLEPYLSPATLPSAYRLGAKACETISILPVILPGLDAILDASSALHQKKILQGLAELSKVKAQEFDKPLAFTLADQDELFAVPSPEKYMRIIDLIKEMYPHARNRSELVRGLNHCLNKTPGDFVPFLKPEEGKDSDRIIEDIVKFFSE
ncbi:alpha/beta hydrolase [Candidatus Woesearchaeota archaeon]|nr:alpha/beta hydrolase [Candidatus Woesearchaeota archaeon]